MFCLTVCSEVRCHYTPATTQHGRDSGAVFGTKGFLVLHIISTAIYQTTLKFITTFTQLCSSPNIEPRFIQTLLRVLDRLVITYYDVKIPTTRLITMYTHTTSRDDSALRSKYTMLVCYRSVNEKLLKFCSLSYFISDETSKKFALRRVGAEPNTIAAARSICRGFT